MVGVELIVFENVKYFGIMTQSSICTCLKMINFVSVFFLLMFPNKILYLDKMWWWYRRWSGFRFLFCLELIYSIKIQNFWNLKQKQTQTQVARSKKQELEIEPNQNANAKTNARSKKQETRNKKQELEIEPLLAKESRATIARSRTLKNFVLKNISSKIVRLLEYCLFVRLMYLT
jgi:hypothetical protein